jgi:membrane protein
VFFWIFFGFLYYFLPNTKVKVFSALFGGIVSGTLYLLAQFAYIYFQVGVSSYSAVYGSFAALPLFLIWVQISWFIFLYGAEVSYAYQSLPLHEFESTLNKASPKFKKMLQLWMLQIVICHFQEKFQPISLFLLLKQCKIPIGTATPLLNELVACNLLTLAKSDELLYMPGRPTEHLRICDALEAIETHGISDMPFLHSKDLAQFEKALHRFAELIEKSSENQILGELNGH